MTYERKRRLGFVFAASWRCPSLSQPFMICLRFVGPVTGVLLTIRNCLHYLLPSSTSKERWVGAELPLHICISMANSSATPDDKLWSETPLIFSSHLSSLLDCNVYLKLEVCIPSTIELLSSVSPSCCCMSTELATFTVFQIQRNISLRSSSKEQIRPEHSSCRRFRRQRRASSRYCCKQSRP